MPDCLYTSHLNTDARVSDSVQFDVILFGYRNDLARARTLDFLAATPASDSGPNRLNATTPLPQRLFAGLEQQRAEGVRAQLESLGAQVTLLPTVQPDPALQISIEPAAAPSRIASPLLTIVLLLLAGIALPMWRAADRRPPPSAPTPAVTTPLQPLRRASALLHKPASARLNAEAIHLADAGEFRDAVDRLESALRLTPDEPVLKENLQTVWLNWGTTDFKADKLDDAALHLRRALQLGERSDVLRALGLVMLRQENYAEAALQLQQAVKLAPTDLGSLLALGRVYLKQEKRPEALAALQRAKDLGARGPELDSMLQQLGREVDAEWNFEQIDSRHFLIRFDGNEGHTPVVLGEKGDEALLGVVTLENLGLVLNPFDRTLRPMRMMLARDLPRRS